MHWHLIPVQDHLSRPNEPSCRHPRSTLELWFHDGSGCCAAKRSGSILRASDRRVRQAASGKVGTCIMDLAARAPTQIDVEQGLRTPAHRDFSRSCTLPI
jgi:hypothetical protein